MAQITSTEFQVSLKHVRELPVLPYVHSSKPELLKGRMWGEKGRSHILYAYPVASLAQFSYPSFLFS